jgi:hypothetical protein
MPIPFLSDITVRAGDFNSLCSLCALRRVVAPPCTPCLFLLRSALTLSVERGAVFDNLSTLIGLTGALGSLGAAVRRSTEAPSSRHRLSRARRCELS